MQNYPTGKKVEKKILDLLFCYNWSFLNLKSFCIQETPKRVLLQTAEYQDVMQHNASFHQALHCL